MADSLLQALMGQSAQERLANDPFYVGGLGLQRQQIAPRNNLEAVLIPALQGLASGGMQAYGRSNVAQSMATSPLLEALKIDRSTLDTSDPFKVETALSQGLLGVQLGQQQQKLNNDLIGEAIKSNPRAQNLLLESLGLKPKSSNPPSPEGIATPDKPETSPLMDALAQGGKTTISKEKEIYNDLLNQGYTPAQASESARSYIKGENQANQGSFDAVKAAREKALGIMGLADTADAGIKLAGQTGFFPGIASGYENLMSALGSSEATSQSQGDALLNSIQPEIVKMSRTPGAVSDREMQSYIQSAPSTSNTPEQNQALAQRIRELGKLENEYADFLSAYRDANNGSVINADKLWNQYRQAVPLFTEDGSVNSQRIPWQSFFQQGGASNGGGAGILEGSGEKIQGYSISELKSAGYSDSDIAALRGQ